MVVVPGCWVIIEFAEDTVGHPGNQNISRAYDVLCTARTSDLLPKRAHAEVENSFFRFTPKSFLPAATFDSLRALNSMANTTTSAWWNPRRKTLALEIGELRRWCTSRQSCLRAWLAPLANFTDLDGFRALPARPVAAPAVLGLYITICIVFKIL